MRPWAWWAASAMLAVGLAWWATDWVLTSLLPLTWGGPNIGGGLLLLVTGGVGLLGLLVMVAAGAAMVVRRRRPRGWALALPLAVDAALLATLVTVRLVLPGDVGPDGSLAGLNGQVGVTVDATGSPVLVLEVCHGSVDAVSVVGPNIDGLNKGYARLHAPAPVTTETRVPLLSPPPGWRGAPASLPLETVEFLIADADGDQSELRQVDFSAADLASLDPTRVHYTDWGADADGLPGRTMALAAFHDYVCAGFEE